MSLWIIYTLSISILIQQYFCYDDPTARVLDIGMVPWKPVPAYHTAISPHYINLGGVNPNNNLHLAQIAAHNAHLMQQIKGFSPPVTQYRNPFPVFQPAPQTHQHHHHFMFQKENPQQIHTSASNIAQTILPSNYLKSPYITGKPAFNLKPEYITKPEFYNGIQTTLGKVQPHVTTFKQLPPVKDAMASLFHEPSYKGFVLSQTPQQYQNHGSIFSYKPQHTIKDKPVGSFSFPNDGLSSLTYFGPASHLIRGEKQSVPKPQPTIYFPSEVGNNAKNVQQQYVQPARNTFQNPSHGFQSVQPIRYESSTPSFFGQTSVKISPSQSYELTFTRDPDGRDIVSSTTNAPSITTYKSETTPVTQTVQPFKSQALPPIPASVLTPFFHHINQEQAAKFSTVSSLQKDKFVNDKYSEDLVPPPYVHLESSNYRTTPHAPTKHPGSLHEQSNSLNILNKYNIPVISPLQDANKFKYDSNQRHPTIIPLNYSVSSIAAFPTNAPQQTPLSIEPTGVFSSVDGFTSPKYNQFSFFGNNQNIHQLNIQPTENQPRNPQNQKFNSEHSFFTIDDVLTVRPTHHTPVSPTSVFNNIQTQVQVQENPEVIIKEQPSTLTTNPPKAVTQVAEYQTTSTTTAAPVLPLATTPSIPTAPSTSVDLNGSRNRYRGKPRRRRPKPSTTDEPVVEENDTLYNQHDTVRERPIASTSTTERNVHRTRLNNRGRIQNRPVNSATSSDPTLRIIQRNSLKSRFNTQDGQPTELYATTAVEYHPASLKPIQPDIDDIQHPNEDVIPNTTALSQDYEPNNAVIPLENYNVEVNPPEETTLSVASLNENHEEPIQSQFDTNSIPSIPSSAAPVLSTEQVLLNQTPQHVQTEPTKPSEDAEPHLSHRQRYKYKIKSTPGTAPESVIEPAVEEELAHAEPSLPSPPSTSSENTKTVTRLRPVNKYRSQDRPRFSVKDYRQRKTHSTSTTSTAAPSVTSSTPAYRNRLRYPSRKRLLPSLRTRASTTEKPHESENNDEPLEESNNEESHSNLNAALPVVTSTSTTSSQSSTFRRVSLRRGGYNRYRSSTSTTEAAASLEEAEQKPVRQWSRDRYNHRSRVSTSSTESLPETHQLNLSPEDLNNIAVETEQPSSTAGAKPESAIMKIGKTDNNSNRQSDEQLNEGQSLPLDDLNEAPSEHSERVAQLTLSGSSHKFNNLNKNSLSRRIPGYFTLATEDPILPIEAFFPNVKSKSNRSR